MRIGHTSDRHLGASLGGFSRLDEQRAVLGEICRLARDKHVDLVLLAGDVVRSCSRPRRPRSSSSLTQWACWRARWPRAW